MRRKKIFYNILAFIIFVGLFSSCSYKENQSSQKYSKSVMVKGNAVINVKPDTAILDLKIKTRGKNIINIQSEHNKIIDNIVDSILKLGVVNNKDIYKSFCNLSTLDKSDYELFTGISVKVRDIDKIEEILNEAMKAGAYKDYNIEFTVSNKSYRRW